MRNRKGAMKRIQALLFTITIMAVNAGMAGTPVYAADPDIQDISAMDPDVLTGTEGINDISEGEPLFDSQEAGEEVTSAEELPDETWEDAAGISDEYDENDRLSESGDGWEAEFEEEPEDADRFSSALMTNGNINASSFLEHDELVITGDTTLNMDTDRYLKCIRGDYALTIKGAGKLSISNPNGDGINVKSITIESDSTVSINASNHGLYTKGKIISSGTLTITSRKDGIKSSDAWVDGDIELYGPTEVTGGENAIDAGGYLQSEVKLIASSQYKESYCVHASAAILDGESVLKGVNPIVIKCSNVILGGNVTINGGVNGTGEVYCIEVHDFKVKSGSDVRITGTGGVRASYQDFDKIEVESGSKLTVNAMGGSGLVAWGPIELYGDVTVNSYGNAVHSEKKYINSYKGVLNLTSTNGKGMRAEQGITIFSGAGNITVKGRENAMYSKDSQVGFERTASLESQNGAVIDARGAVRLIADASLRQTGSGYCIRSREGTIYLQDPHTITMEGGKGIRAEKGSVEIYAKNVTISCMGDASVSAENEAINIGRLTSSPVALTVSGCGYGLKAKNINIYANSTVDARGTKSALYASEKLAKYGTYLSILKPAGGKLLANTVVDTSGNPAKEVLIAEQKLEGTVTITNGSEVVAGNVLGLNFSGIPANRIVQWQKRKGESDYVDIIDGRGETYTTKPGEVGWTLRAKVLADGYAGEVYSDERTIVAQPSLSGTITYNNPCTVGIPLTTTCNLNPSVSALGDKLHYFWQSSLYEDKGFSMIEGAEASSPSYTPKLVNVGNYVRMGVYADGYAGMVFGAAKLVKKQANTSDPKQPKLSVGAPFSKVTITNAREDQEYLVTYPADGDMEIHIPDPDSGWTDAVHPDSDGAFNISANPDKRVIVFTRMRATPIQNAGKTVAYSKIYNGQTVELQDIELSIKEINGSNEADVERDGKNGYYYVMPDKVYKITANPVPEMGTDFDGIKAGLWRIDDTNPYSSVYGKYYTTKECTALLDPTSSTYYHSVYYKATDNMQKNGLKLSASNAGGSVSDSIMLAQGSSSGGYKCNIVMPYVTIRKGDKNSDQTFSVIPEKGTLGTMTATKNSGTGTAPVITFNTADYSITVDASSADTGEFTYKVTDTEAGNSVNDLYVNVEPTTCEVTLDPGEGTGAPVVEDIVLGSQFILPDQPAGFAPKAGCKFDGWDKGAVGDGITVDGPITITAKWKEHTHKMSHFPAFDPTCLSAGNIEYYKCMDCGQMFSDKDGLNPITDPVIPATGHDPISVRENEIPADEDNDGSYDQVTYCSNCGDELGRTHVTVQRRILEKFTISANTGDGGFGPYLQNNTVTLDWKDSLSVDPARYSVSDAVEPEQEEDSEDGFNNWPAVDTGYVTYTIENNTENDSSLIFSKLVKENCTLTVSGFNSECIRVTPYLSAGKSSVDIVFKMTAKKEYAVKAGPVSSIIELSDDGSYMPPAGQDIWLYDIGTKNVNFNSFTKVSDNPEDSVANVILTGPGAEVFEIKKTLASYPITITPGNYGPVCTVDVKTGLALKPNFVYTADLTLRTEEGASVTVPLSLTVTPPSITGIWMEDIPAQNYTGTKITPTVAVYWGEKLLSTDDYSVSYSNNVNAYTLTEGQEGFNASKAPSITVKGKGNYKGTFTKAFVIKPADLKTQAVAQTVRLKYTGKDQRPTTTVTATLGGQAVTLKAGKDYEYEYAASGYNEPGSYNIKIRPKSTNFKGSQSFEAVIIDGVPMSKVSVSNIANIKYDGTIHHPAVTVKCGGKTLTQGVDYVLEYNDPSETYKSVGKATVTIKGTENVLPGHDTYFGTVTKTFNITGISLAGAKMETMAGFKATVPYSGIAIEQDPLSFELTLDKGSTVIPFTGYDVKYEDNINAGTAKMIFTGRPDAGYTGQLTKSFKITGHDLNAGPPYVSVFYKYDGTEYIWQESTYPEFLYNLGGVTPDITVKLGLQTLTEGRDYTVKLSNNSAVKTDLSSGKIPTVTIKGKGNFAGEAIRYFKIGKKSFSDAGLTVIASDVQWQDKAGICNPSVTILEKLTGKVLKAGTDYYGPKDKDHPFKYQYVSLPAGGKVYDYDAGTKLRTDVTASIIPGTEVKPSHIIPEGAKIKAIIRGKGAYTEDDITAEFKYVTKDLNISGSAFKITIADKQWTGAPVELTEDDVTLTYKQSKTVTRTLKWGLDFEIVQGSYINNINRGTAKVTIRGLNHGTDLFGGTKQISFKIVERRMNYVVTYDGNRTGLMDLIWNRMTWGDRNIALSRYGSKDAWFDANYRITGSMKASDISYGGKMTANAYKVQKYEEASKKWVNASEAEASFKGWAVKETGGRVLSDKDSFRPSWLWRLTYDDSITLYAVW
ncbi:MAG: carbohydrate-binding domain-containing protein [Lachnospiraceae bacterium]|nr:carbohydrate-binding domain-containing protein [Lachnospiraceae bacterium]